jgi:hypothetical protein
LTEYMWNLAASTAAMISAEAESGCHGIHQPEG